MNNLPDFTFEKELWADGYDIVAGADEVGRGCFAGPVVAGVAVFKKNAHKFFAELEEEIPKINDSKKLTIKQREEASDWLKANTAGYAIGRSSVEEINEWGIGKATFKAFRRATSEVHKTLKIEHLLIDAFNIPHIKNLSVERQTAVTKGDEKSLSIAAASIIAKVERDKMMTKLGKREEYKIYEWGNNKGYGTKVHRNAILQNGVTSEHRRDYIQTFLDKLKTKNN